MNLPIVLATFGIVIVHPVSEGYNRYRCQKLKEGHVLPLPFKPTTRPFFLNVSCLKPVPRLETVAQLEGFGSKEQARLTTVFPVLFDCCTEVAHHIPRRWLRTVAMFDIQNGGDLCKISAVIIHAKHKKLCVSPENRHVKRWMKQVGRWRTGHHPRKRKKAKRRRKSGRKEPCPSC